MRRLIFCILVALACFRPAQAGPESPALAWLPSSDYGRPSAALAIARLMEQRRWREAIVEIEEMLCRAHPADLRIEPWEWRVAAGWLYLFDQRPREALRQFELVRQQAPPDTTSSYPRWWAAQGIAQSLTETGEYARAAAWLRANAVAPGCGCGTGKVTEWLVTEAIARTWLAADQPAMRPLMDLRARQYPAVRLGDRDDRYRVPLQKRHAAAEATLALGRRLLEQGDTARGKRLLHSYLQATDIWLDYPTWMIVLTRLDRLERGRRTNDHGGLGEGASQAGEIAKTGSVEAP